MRVVAPTTAAGVKPDAREGAGPAPVQAGVTLYATLLSPANTLSHVLPDTQFTPGARGEERKVYVHVVQTSGYNTNAASGAHVRVSGAEDGPLDLREGDGAYIMAAPGEELVVENVGDRIAEVLLFDME